MAEIHDDHFGGYSGCRVADYKLESVTGSLTRKKIGYRTVASCSSMGVQPCLSLSFWRQWERLCKALSAMEQFIQANQAPFIAKVYKSGEVKHGRTEKLLRTLYNTNS